MIQPKHILVFVDLLLAFSSLICAFLLRFLSADSLNLLWREGLLRICIYLVVIVIISYFFELYEKSKFISRKFLILRCVYTSLVTFLVLSTLFFLFPPLEFGRGVLVLSFILFALAQIISRLILRSFLSAAQFASRILIVGSGELAKRTAEFVPKDHNIHSYVRFISCTDKKPVVASELIVGNVKKIDELIQDYQPQKLIIALSERRGNLPLREMMHSKLRGVDILDAPAYYERTKECLLVEHIQPSDFVYTHRFRMTSFMKSYKRLFDVVFSSIIFLFSLPVIPFIVLLIKLDSPGSVLFKQLRVGEHEVEYFIYKFRTMTQDAEKDSGPVWAQKEDPRITQIGRFLRKTRLDEIPQLINVLRGDMSLIGPRPERMAFVDHLKKTIPFYSTRHYVKPGLTGWAQVCYPYGASDEDALEKLRYDLYYIKNYSIILDLRIILDTVKVVTSGYGGR